MRSRRPPESPPCRLCGFTVDDPDGVPFTSLERLDQIDGCMTPAMPAVKPFREKFGEDSNTLISQLMRLDDALKASRDFLPPNEEAPPISAVLKAILHATQEQKGFLGLMATLFPEKRQSGPGNPPLSLGEIKRYGSFLNLRNGFLGMAKRGPATSGAELFRISLRTPGLALLTPRGFEENPRIQEVRDLLQRPRKQRAGPSPVQVANLAAWAFITGDQRRLRVLLGKPALLDQANALAEAARKKARKV